MAANNSIEGKIDKSICDYNYYVNHCHRVYFRLEAALKDCKGHSQKNWTCKNYLSL